MDRLYILGCGTPFPTADRFGSSYVVRTGDEYLMFDCGPATTWKMAKAGLWPTQVDNLFFTHHHSDHDMDYPCFIETRWDLGVGKVSNLNVYGPTLTEQLTTRLIDPDVGAFAHDWKVRTNHPLSLYSFTLRGGTPLQTMGPDGTNFREPPTEMVVAKDIGPGRVCEGKDWQVTSARAEHVQPYLDSLAYRLDTDDGSIVITGDTTPCETVAELSQGADVVVLSCVGVQSEIDGGGDGDYMCGTTGAGRLAEEAGVKKLVLVHNTPIALQGEMERAIADVATVYSGEIVFGDELMEIDLRNIGQRPPAHIHAASELTDPFR